MISILNALFDVQAKAIHGHGGEILKFIGRSACDIPDPGWRHSGLATNARAAAQEAVAAVRCLSGEPFMAVEPPLEIVVALHVGTVVYGNIGAAERRVHKSHEIRTCRCRSARTPGTCVNAGGQASSAIPAGKTKTRQKYYN